MQAFWAWMILTVPPTDPRYMGLFLLGAIGEMSVPAICEAAWGKTRWHRGHIAERYGLLNLIVLGECFLSVTSILVVKGDGGLAGAGQVELALGAAIVTSRERLSELDARLLDLGALPAEAAVELLDRALRLREPADTRVTAEPEHARRLAELCGGLPLALRIVAATHRRHGIEAIFRRSHVADLLEIMPFDLLVTNLEAHGVGTDRKPALDRHERQRVAGLHPPLP